MAGLATLVEVKHQWSIDDLFDAFDLLDIRAQAESEALQRAKGHP